MNILVVDDSKVMRSIVIRTLRQAGFEGATIAEAGNGVEALKAMVANKPDLAFLDWNMPELNGIELAEKLRAAGIAIRFGFVTTECSPEMRERAKAAGALFLIAKPFTVESFQQALAAVQ